MAERVSCAFWGRGDVDPTWGFFRGLMELSYGRGGSFLTVHLSITKPMGMSSAFWLGHKMRENQGLIFSLFRKTLDGREVLKNVAHPLIPAFERIHFLWI